MDEDGVKAALNAFKANAPYYPRLLRSSNTERQAKDAFVRAYMVMAGNILEHECWPFDDRINSMSSYSGGLIVHTGQSSGG